MGGWNKNTKSLPIFNNATVPFEIIIGIVRTELGKRITEDFHLFGISTGVTDSSRTNVERAKKIVFHHEKGWEFDREASDKAVIGTRSLPRKKFTSRVM
jgi:hypothetical protein